MPSGGHGSTGLHWLGWPTAENEYTGRYEGAMAAHTSADFLDVHRIGLRKETAP